VIGLHGSLGSEKVWTGAEIVKSRSQAVGIAADGQLNARSRIKDAGTGDASVIPFEFGVTKWMLWAKSLVLKSAPLRSRAWVHIGERLKGIGNERQHAADSDKRKR
jgi:hypothetical protein